MKKYLLIVALLIAISIPAFAQDETEQPVPTATATVEATEEATVVVTPAPAPTLSPEEVSEVVTDSFTVITEVTRFAALGGFAIGIGATAMFMSLIRFVSKNRALKNAIERLFMRLQPGQKQVIRQVVVNVKETTTLADELTDEKLDP